MQEVSAMAASGEQVTEWHSEQAGCLVEYERLETRWCHAAGPVATCRLTCVRSCLLARLRAAEAEGQHDVVA